jgi:hypothetical protein
MPSVTLLDNEYATLWHHEESQIIHHQFKKWAKDGNFRDVLDKGYAQAQAKGVKKWLSDDRNNLVLSQADGEWATTVWVPKMVKIGWKYWAVVMPEKAVGKLNMQQFIEGNAKHGITVKVFTEPVAALEWLKIQV